MTPPRAHSAAARMWPAPAHELLIRAALGPSDEARAAFATWSARVDVDALDVTSQRLLPLLAARDGLGTWPPGLAEQVRRVERFAWVQGQARLAKARPALEALAAEHIPMLLGKGLAVVTAAGINPRTRLMDDIDLIVPRESAVTATTVLEHLGYTSPERQDTITAAVFDQHSGVNLENPAGARIDLHGHFLQRSFGPDADAAFWSAARPGVLLDVPVLVARREDLVLQAVIHGASPVRPRAMRWLTDAVALIGAGPFDWDRLVAQARAHDSALFLAGALQTIAALTTTAVPSEPIARLLRRPLVIQRLATHQGNRRAPLRRRELLADELLAWRGRNGRRSPIGFGASTLGLTTLSVLAKPQIARIELARPRDVILEPRHLTSGFFAVEPHGAWTAGRVAVVDLPFAEPAGGDLRLHVGLTTTLAPLLPERTIVVLHGRRPIARWRLRGDGFAWFPLHADLTVPDGTRGLRLRFLVSRPAAPQLIGTTGDHRPVGIALRMLTISRRAPAGS